jgi:membrane associated rhomboid family serine protease
MTLIIVLITIGVSIFAFSRRDVFVQLAMRPYMFVKKHQYYRIFSHALIHADWPHLLINMYVLYIFGKVCEGYFTVIFGAKASLHFVMLYLFSIVFSSIYSIIKHRNNMYYSAVGASGAVMAVVFTTIFFDPWSKLWFFGVIPIPGIVFGILYLIYSIYMGKKNVDNVGHDAHFSGAIFGFLYPIIADFSLLSHFIEKLFGR